MKKSLKTETRSVKNNKTSEKKLQKVYKLNKHQLKKTVSKTHTYTEALNCFAKSISNTLTDGRRL